MPSLPPARRRIWRRRRMSAWCTATARESRSNRPTSSMSRRSALRGVWAACGRRRDLAVGGASPENGALGRSPKRMKPAFRISAGYPLRTSGGSPIRSDRSRSQGPARCAVGSGHRACGLNRGPDAAGRTQRARPTSASSARKVPPARCPSSSIIRIGRSAGARAGTR
jgi:hypothetical protein